MLTEDTPYVKKDALARVSLAEMAEHIRQLDELKTFLEAFGNDPASFITRVQSVSQDDNSYIARLKRADDPGIGEGIENAQTQLAFFAQLSESTDPRDTAIEGASIKGITPHAAIRRADREVRGGRVILNTVKVFRAHDSSKTLLVPQAGIEIVREGDYIDINGLKSVGPGHFHRLAVYNEGELERKDYETVISLAMQLSGATAGY